MIVKISDSKNLSIVSHIWYTDSESDIIFSLCFVLSEKNWTKKCTIKTLKLKLNIKIKLNILFIYFKILSLLFDIKIKEKEKNEVYSKNYRSKYVRPGLC